MGLNWQKVVCAENEHLFDSYFNAMKSIPHKFTNGKLP